MMFATEYEKEFAAAGELMPDYGVKTSIKCSLIMSVNY
jgi:hypothetical protein